MVQGPREYKSSLLTVDNLKLDGNTISSTNTNGNIVLSPNGAGATTAPNGLFSLGTNGSQNGSITLYSMTNNAISYFGAGSSGQLEGTATAWFTAASGAGNNLYLRAGNLFVFQDVDATNANRATIDSANGNTWLGGTLATGGSITQGTDGAGNTLLRMNSGAAGYYAKIDVTTGGVTFSGVNIPTTIFSSGSNLNLKASYSSIFQNSGGTAVAEITNNGAIIANSDITSKGRYIAQVTDQNITAVGNTIACTTSHMRLSPNANLTLTSTPSIAAAGSVGQLLMITNASDTYTLTIQEVANLAGSTVHSKNQANIVLAPRQGTTFCWDGTYWVEV